MTKLGNQVNLQVKYSFFSLLIFSMKKITVPGIVVERGGGASGSKIL